MEFPLEYPKVMSSLAGCGMDEACSISAFTKVSNFLSSSNMLYTEQNVSLIDLW